MIILQSKGMYTFSVNQEGISKIYHNHRVIDKNIFNIHLQYDYNQTPISKRHLNKIVEIIVIK